MAIPKLTGYALPTAADLPNNKVSWAFEPERAALLIHDMQEYFLNFWGDNSPMMEQVVADLLAGRLTHASQESLNKSREGARKRPIGKAGGWGYDRSDASVDIAPLVAVTLARLSAEVVRRPVVERRVVVLS